METLFDDIPDPEPPPGQWMPTEKLQAALDDLAMGLTATQKSIAAAFDVPLEVLTEPTVPPPVTEAEAQAAFNDDPAPFTDHELDHLTQPQIVDKLISGTSYGKATDWNEPIPPVSHNWLKDILTKPVPMPVLVKLQLHEVEHHPPYDFGSPTHYRPPWMDSELTFVTTSGPMEVTVKMTGHQWKQMGSPQTLTIQVLGE